MYEITPAIPGCKGPARQNVRLNLWTTAVWVLTQPSSAGGKVWSARCQGVRMQPSKLLVLWRRAFCVAVAISALAALPSGRPAAATESFPFNEELLLDAKPMRGSKRVPMLEIRPDGAVLIDLWCNSVQGQLVVAANTITVLTGPKTDRACPPERLRGDEDVLSALEQVTTWRREGDDVVLIGPQSLRFHRATN